MVENCSDFPCSTLSLFSAIFFSVQEKKRKKKKRKQILLNGDDFNFAIGEVGMQDCSLPRKWKSTECRSTRCTNTPYRSSTRGINRKLKVVAQDGSGIYMTGNTHEQRTVLCEAQRWNLAISKEKWNSQSQPHINGIKLF